MVNFFDVFGNRITKKITPIRTLKFVLRLFLGRNMITITYIPNLDTWWGVRDLNPRPTDYESAALTG